ncbi:MAG: phage portal protein, partial [Planctomycetes bacterium]|nr:phage portal protein [Planctomycetota bacterium]
PPISRLTLKTKGAGDVEPLDDHPVLDLLADPNDLQTSWGLLWSTVASINLCGRAFWWVTEGNEELHLLPTSWVLGSTGSTRFQSWKVQPPGHGETIEIPSERMVYFALPSPSDPWGSVSPLQTAAAAVDNDADILRSQRAAFHQGVYARHALIIGRQPVEGLSGGLRPRLTPTQHRQLINAVRKRYEGLANNEPLILDGLIEDVKTLTNSPHEMDWRESAESMKSRIMQAFGTSSYLVGGTEPGSRAASAVAETHFLNNTVNPIIRMMSEAMTEWLSPMFGGGLKIWVEPCVADDADLRIQWATLLSQNGSLSVHELRSLSPFGLSENNAFDNQLVGGENMKTLNPIQRGVERMVQNSVASLAADSGRFGDVLPALTFSGGNGDR